MILLSGCASPTPPAWLYTTQQPLSVCGDGDGESQHEAKMKSIASMTHAIGVNVKAVYEYQRRNEGGSVYVNRSESSRIENLFPTLVQLSTAHYEVRKNWWTERHYLRSCVTYASIADSLEESLKTDETAVKKANETIECLSRDGRDNYDKRRDKIESKLSLLRAYRPESEMIGRLADVGLKATNRAAVHLLGDFVLVMPLISKNGIVAGSSGAIMEVVTLKEIHNYPVVKKGSSLYLCVLRTRIRFTNGCGELMYEKEFKCVDEGKTKKVSEINARAMMVKLLGQSDLNQALERY